MTASIQSLQARRQYLRIISLRKVPTPNGLAYGAHSAANGTAVLHLARQCFLQRGLSHRRICDLVSPALVLYLTERTRICSHRRGR